MSVIAFPSRTNKPPRKRRRYLRVTVGDVEFQVSPAGMKLLHGCLEFELSHQLLPYHDGTRAAMRLVRQGLVMETYDILANCTGICLTPAGRAVAAQLAGPAGEAG